VSDGIGLLEVQGLGPALVAIDTMEKAANVTLDHMELNDYYGVCIKITGDSAALTAAIGAAEDVIEKMHGQCVSSVMASPDRRALKVINSPVEYQPLIEQNVVFYPTSTSSKINKNQGNQAMAQQASFALGLIETQGFTAVMEAIDTACKAADVQVIGKEKLGGGYITVLLKGDVAAVEAAVQAGKAKVDGLGTLISAHVIARPSQAVLSLLPEG
jgi:carbon dioxide concentrating mechanism protein CcmO